jgi:hypothetical protein
MPMMGFRFTKRTALRLAVAVGGLCAAAPAFAGTEICTITYDSNGHATIDLQRTGIFSAQFSGCAAQTNFSSTYSSALSFNPAPVTINQVNANSTEIIGRLNGGNILYDQRFSAAFNTPVVQAGVNSAIMAITTAGGPGVVIMSPTLVSHVVSTSSTSSSVYTLSGVNTTSAVTTTIGPAILNALPATYVSPGTIVIGGDTFTTIIANPALAPALPNIHTTCTPTLSTVTNATINTPPVGTVLAAMPVCTANNGGSITLAGGQVNINVDFTTTFTIDTATTTTNTTTTAEVYDIDGLSVQGIGTVHAAVIEGGFDRAERFGRRLLDDLGGRGTGQAPLTRRLHLWLEPYAWRAVTSADGGIVGNRRTGYGMNGGLGYVLTPNLTIGAAADVGTTSIDDVGANEHAGVDTTQIGVSGDWHGKTFYAHVAGSYGWARATTNVTPTGFTQTASAAYRLRTASVSGEIGAHLAVPGTAGLTLTPALGLSHAGTHSRGFIESGSIVALVDPANDYDRTKAWAGLTAETRRPAGDHGSLDISVYGRAVEILGSRNVALPTTFVGSTIPLTIRGVNASRLGADFGASLGYDFNDRVRLFAAGDARLRDGFTSETGSVGLRVVL